MHMTPSYVLMAAARNEAKQIRYCLDSVVSQSILPLRFVVVSDASTDDTDRIVAEYAERFPFIRLIRLNRTGKRNFGAKAEALAVATEELSDLSPEFIVAMDADCSFAPDFFARVFAKFDGDDRLGIAGGLVYEFRRHGMVSLRNYEEHVSGLMQVFRRKCFEDVGGYQRGVPGNIDSIAVITAKMHGWKTRAFKDLPIYHHRPEGTGEGSILKARFNNGVRDHLLGYHPVFLLAMSLGRVTEPPYVIGSVLRVLGYTWGALRSIGKDRPLPGEFVRYLRREQMRRLFALISVR